MFKPNFEEYKEVAQKERLPEGVHILKLKSITEFDRGFKFELVLDDEHYAYEYAFWTHSDKAMVFTNNCICGYYKTFNLPISAPITSLVGKSFKLELEQGEKYLNHVGFLNAVKANAQTMAAPTVLQVPKKDVPKPPTPPTPPTPPPSVSDEYRYSNGHTKQELLNAGWSESQIETLDSDFDNDIPF